MDILKPSVDQLKLFRPLNNLSENQLVLASAHAEIKRYQEGEVLFKVDSHDRYEYFLLEGKVELESFDGRFKEVEAGSEGAHTAIALLQPRKYTVRAVKNSLLILIQQSVIEALLRELPDLSEVDFNVSSIQSGHEVADILESFKNDLEHNTVKLPSFPDAALKIRKLLDSPDVSVKQVTQVLQSEPAITVKLIKACNSPLYKSVKEINSAQDAVVRLGFDTTRQLVTIFAMNEVYRSSNKLLRQRMRHYWEHASSVAAISYVLGKLTPGLDPELALLAGLVKDIGVVPLLNYIEDYPQFLADEAKVDALLKELKGSVGAMLLKHWGFKQALVDVAESSGQWSKATLGEAPNYVDLAIVAEVHSLLGKSADPESQPYKDKAGGIPQFSEIPAFKKLGDHGLTPEQSQNVLHESSQQIRSLQALLGSVS